MKISSVDDAKQVFEDAKTEVALYRNPDFSALLESFEWVLEELANTELERDDLKNKLDEMDDRRRGLELQLDNANCELRDEQRRVRALEQDIIALEVSR